MEPNYILCKITYYQDNNLHESRDVKDQVGTVKFLKKHGATDIKIFKQTNYKDKTGAVIYEKDTILYNTGGISCGVNSVEMVVLLNDEQIYKYGHGYSGGGIELSLNYNHIDFRKTLVIGDIELLRSDLSRVLIPKT